MFDGSITMSYNTLNYQVHFVDVVNRNQRRRKSGPSRSFFNAKASPSLLKTEGNGNLSESKNFEATSSTAGSGFDSPVLSSPNAIGVIGGVSAVSTLSFLEKLVKGTSLDGEETLPLIVCSDPCLNRELLLHERSFLPYPTSINNNIQYNHTSIVGNLRQKRLFMERSGARCVVMPCHISHAWHKEISEDCSVPFLNVGDCVAKEIRAANFRPIEAGSNVRIGVLTTDTMLTSRIYQEKLQSQGFDVIYPDKATMEHTVVPAVSAFRRNDMEGARNLLRIALQVLLLKAVNTIIVASDDMNGLLPQDDPLVKKCIDPMDSLVRETIKWARSLKESEED
ncbi:uncharacterized protein [Typha angustifolia]|uniref:uncharacterized protein n=1 Tax=Typha angustifolia TaxID=59011 RepID=UPI003C2D6F2D